MRKAYYTLDLTEAVLLKDHLLHNGIAADVRHKGAVRIPHEGVASEVWIADDADADAVRGLIRTFLERKTETLAGAQSSWRCPQCREDNPAAFELCWNCGKIAAANGAS